MRRIDAALEGGERSGASSPRALENKQALLDKKEKLNEQLAARTAAFNAYMAPVLDETAAAGKKKKIPNILTRCRSSLNGSATLSLKCRATSPIVRTSRPRRGLLSRRKIYKVSRLL